MSCRTLKIRSLVAVSPLTLWLVASSVAPFAGCGEQPVVAPEDRIVRVALDPSDRSAIREPQYAMVVAAIIGIRELEAAAPSPEAGTEAISAHADRVAEATSGVVAIMADERWTRQERRLMQRVLRYATLSDLRDEPVETDPADG